MRLQLEERTVDRPCFHIVFLSESRSTKPGILEGMQEADVIELQSVQDTSLQIREMDMNVLSDPISELKQHFKAKVPNKHDVQPLPSAMKPSVRKTSLKTTDTSSTPGFTRYV